MSELKPCPFCGVSVLRHEGHSLPAVLLHPAGECPLGDLYLETTFWNKRTLRDREGLREAIVETVRGIDQYGERMGQSEVDWVADAILAEVEKRL